MDYLNSDLMESKLYRKLSQVPSSALFDKSNTISDHSEMHSETLKRSKSCYISDASHADKMRNIDRQFGKSVVIPALDDAKSSTGALLNQTSELSERKDNRSNSLIQTISTFGKKLKNFLGGNESPSSEHNLEPECDEKEVWARMGTNLQSDKKRSITPLQERPSSLLKRPSTRALSRLVVTNQLDSGIPAYRKSAINLLKETDKSRMSVVAHNPPRTIMGLGGSNFSGIDGDKPGAEMNFPDLSYDAQSQTKRTCLRHKTVRIDLVLDNSWTASENNCIKYEKLAIVPATQNQFHNEEENFSYVTGAKVFERKKLPNEQKSLAQSGDLDYKKLFSMIDN